MERLKVVAELPLFFPFWPVLSLEGRIYILITSSRAGSGTVSHRDQNTALRNPRPASSHMA